MSTIIEIAAIRPPKEGKKMGTVVAATGVSFLTFPNVASKLQVGERYEVDVEDMKFDDRIYRKITKAKPAAAANGNGTSNGNARSIPISTSPADAELAFVSSTLNAFIAAGKISLDARELGQATQLLRLLWSHTFGSDGGARGHH
jgi:hypothetical protein